jgi:hypothetical protein
VALTPVKRPVGCVVDRGTLLDRYEHEELQATSDRRSTRWSTRSASSWQSVLGS